jgi:hypothetical protein
VSSFPEAGRARRFHGGGSETPPYPGGTRHPYLEQEERSPAQRETGRERGRAVALEHAQATAEAFGLCLREEPADGHAYTNKRGTRL